MYKSAKPRPLELKRYYVLLALAQGPRHPYGIVQQATDDSSQSLYLSLTTLDRILPALMRQGLVSCIGTHQASSRDVLVYEITTSGRRLLEQSASILAASTRIALRRL